MTYVFILAFFLAISRAIAQVEECPELYRRFSADHSYCRPRNPNCKVLQEGVSPEDIEVIVRTHNEFRSKVATGNQEGLPPASDMLQIEWDDEMAKVAQNDIYKCRYGRDCWQCRFTANFEPGQNLAEGTINQDNGSLPIPDWKGTITAWFNEVKVFNVKDIDSFPSGLDVWKTWDFTQMTWAKVWKVGCYYAFYTHDSYTIYYRYTCNYGPAANYVGKPIYRTGQPYTNCPLNSCPGTNCATIPNYEGLCQLTECRGPKYPRDPRYIFFCNFEDGIYAQSDCSHEVAGVNEWKVANALMGPMLGIVLNGGERTVLNFTTRMKTTEDATCLEISYRMGPNIAGEDATGKLVATIVDNYDNWDDVELPPRSTFEEPFTIDIQWIYDLQLFFTFEVPHGGQKQYVEFGEISFRNGQCP